MGKLRDSKPKPDIFEVTTIQTRRGRRITQIPIKDTEPTSSPTRSASPSKKRPLSPGVREHDDYNNSTTDQIPKRSRTVGKVRRKFVSIGNNRTGLYRHKTSSSRNISVNGIAFLSSFSDTNHYRRSPHARIANNLPAHIGVGIALVRNIGVMPVVSLLT